MGSYLLNLAIPNELCSLGALSPIRAIQRTVLHRFGQMLGFDIGRGVEVGDGARDFEDAVVGAGGKGGQAGKPVLRRG